MSGGVSDRRRMTANSWWRHLPPTRLEPRVWLAVLLSVLAMLYAVHIGVAIWYTALFDYVGNDYRSFRASADIARSIGFAEVYDLTVQEQFQRPLYESFPPLSSSGAWRMRYGTIPTYFIPAFVAPLLPLLLFDPVSGFILWTTLNTAILLWYLRRLSRAAGGYGGRMGLLVLLLSFPAFTTLLFGQVNVWLLIFFGEFMIAAVRGKQFRAGLWLGGMLLKPQVLPLLLLGLLIGRRFRTLSGFVVAALVLLLISVCLSGVQGLIALVRLILLEPTGLPGVFPEGMMNWRALAVNLSSIAPPKFSWGVAMLGLVSTVAFAASLWRRFAARSPSRFAIILLGTYAAACTVAWHSLVHMALPLLAPLVYLAANRCLPPKLLNIWAITPALAFLVTAFELGSGFAHILAALSLLIINLCLVVWAARAVHQPPPMPATKVEARTVL